MNRVLSGLVFSLAISFGVCAHELSIHWTVFGEFIEFQVSSDDDPVAGAEIQVRDPTGKVLDAGKLDDSGRYRWQPAGVGPVNVVVDAGAGHRQSLTLTVHDLQRARADVGGAAANRPPVEADGAGAHAHVSGSSEATFSRAVRVGLGLTFLLALTSAWLGYRNSKRLSALEHRFSRDES
jgi:hypothetical protein